MTLACFCDRQRSYGYSFSGARASETGGQGRSWLRRGTGVTSPVLRDGALRHTPGVGFRPQSGGPFRTAHGDAKSVSALTDASGAVTSTQERDAFGVAVSSSGDWSTPFQYGGRQGYQTDDTGLQLLGHRYYDPSTGRFLTRDPIKDGPNWYAYCQNDPVNRADASGVEWHDPTRVEVSPGFKGTVIAYGDFSWMEKEGWRDVVVGGGQITHKDMDVDMILIKHDDGREDWVWLGGTKGGGATYTVLADGSVVGSLGSMPPWYPGRVAWIVTPTGVVPVPTPWLGHPWNGWIDEAGATGFPLGYEPSPSDRWGRGSGGGGRSW